MALIGCGVGLTVAGAVFGWYARGKWGQKWATEVKTAATAATGGAGTAGKP